MEEKTRDDSEPQDFTFTDQEIDRETGLMYYGARYYDPKMGRFIQEDPVLGVGTDPKTYNGYIYVTNNPLKYTDPDGRYRRGALRSFKSAGSSIRGRIKAKSMENRVRAKTRASHVSKIMSVIKADPMMTAEEISFNDKFTQSKVKQHNDSDSASFLQFLADANSQILSLQNAYFRSTSTLQGSSGGNQGVIGLPSWIYNANQSASQAIVSQHTDLSSIDQPYTWIGSMSLGKKNSDFNVSSEVIKVSTQPNVQEHLEKGLDQYLDGVGDALEFVKDVFKATGSMLFLGAVVTALYASGNHLSAKSLAKAMSQFNTSDVSYGNDSAFADAIRESTTFENIMADIEGNIGDGKYSGSGDDVFNDSFDLFGSINKANYEYSAIANNNGGFDVELSISDTYDFEKISLSIQQVIETYSNEGLFGVGKDMAVTIANNVAAEALHEGYIHEYDITVNMTATISP